MNAGNGLSQLMGWTRRAVIAVLALTATASATTPHLTVSNVGPGKIVVADRNSGTVSVISAITDEVIETLELPAAANPAEPMYVVYSPVRNRFFVGDRANDRVVAFDARTLDATAEVPTGAGVFHMWGNTRAGQLWVNNDIDKSSTVIDLLTLEVIATVPTPSDIVEMGGKPHDVIFSPDGTYAYVTHVALEGEFDYVVQFDTETFEELGSVAVGKDPHLSVTRRNNVLYVPCQESGEVFIFDLDTLMTEDVLAIPGAHGAGMAYYGDYFYVSNLPGGGMDALWTIDTATNEIVGDPVDTPYEIPHNIALTPTGKLYVTHSGPNDKVTVFTTSGREPTPMYLGEVTVGMNPFGLAWVP